MVSSMEYDFSSSGKGQGGYVKKSLIWGILVVFIVLLLTVGLLSGLLAAKKAREETETKYEKLLKEKENYISTTLSPTTIISQEPKTTEQHSTTTAAPCKGVWCNVRLPQNVVPYHYDLFIKANVAELKYEGKQKISVRVKEQTKTVLFHIKEMKVDSVMIKDASQAELQVKDSFSYPVNEYYVIVMKKNLQIGDYTVIINFHANVSKLLTGFYKSSYKQDGDDKVLLTTKFQPTDARKAFPCFDEPDLKATFNVTVDHPTDYKARSNTPGVTTKTSGSTRSVTKFGKTVKMSTYLICFIVSQFEYKFEEKAGIENNVTITIWSRPDYINSTEYAFNTSKQMLTYLESYLGVAYPMPKLDMFAIPDYGSGATEHWGIITYRESRLLYTPGVSSASNKKSSAGIISHECAHLWFGNLVTCKWWNDLWVQEGMASYLEYLAMNNSHPEWDMIDQFISSDWKTGITLDALASSHPISQPVDHPKQIKEIFDSITYNKGSSLFQMLHYFLGDNTFKAGLNLYLTKNKFKGATVNDLWHAFSQVSSVNITNMMNTWTYQMGFPVVTVVKQNSSFVLTQKHFLIDPQAKVTQTSKYGYQWIIPFTYATSDDLTKTKILVMDKQTVNINSTANWLLGNNMQRGFYRVNYDTAGWKEIADQLKSNHKIFSITGRAGIIDNAFALARAGQLSYTTAFGLLSYIDQEESSIVWSMVLSNLDYLSLVLNTQRIYKRYQKFVASKVKSLYMKYPLKYLSAGCRIELDEAVENVNKMFQDWMINGTQIPADVRSTVYYYGIAFGNYERWDFVYQRFLTTDDPSDRSKLQKALGASRNILTLNKWLEMTIDTTKVRSQDTAYVISAIAGNNPIGKYLAWSFAASNWEAIIKIAKENNFHVARLTAGLTSQFTTEFDLKEVKKLWAKYPNAGTGKKAREQGLEKIRANVYWLNTYYATVEKWLLQEFKE